MSLFLHALKLRWQHELLFSSNVYPVISWLLLTFAVLSIPPHHPPIFLVALSFLFPVSFPVELFSTVKHIDSCTLNTSRSLKFQYHVSRLYIIHFYGHIRDLRRLYATILLLKLLTLSPLRFTNICATTFARRHMRERHLRADICAYYERNPNLNRNLKPNPNFKPNPKPNPEPNPESNHSP